MGTDIEKKLLVIDDESAVREAVIDILETVDIDVLQAQDGETGLKILEENIDQIGAILLDMRMPGMDGVETLHEIRKLAQDLHVIVSTGYSIEIARRTFGELQPNEFLTKPYDINTLIEHIQNALKTDN